MLRLGLLKSLHSGHPGVVSMLLRAKESFWWPGLKNDMEDVRARCLQWHENPPSQGKESSIGVPGTKYAFESLLII